MLVSGTLHLYSGEDRELFFVFDDDVAQQLYQRPELDIHDRETRRVWISVGSSRFIHRRTLSFSGKQTEIKVSLCSRNTKDGLGSLTSLYDWFAPATVMRPAPVPVEGQFRRTRRGRGRVWELTIEHASMDSQPSAFLRRTRKDVATRERWWKKRREIGDVERERIGRLAETLAITLAKVDYPAPSFSCLWRVGFYDSERVEIRKLGIICDIDIWNTDTQQPKAFIEVKAQKVSRMPADPEFYITKAEWHSYEAARKARLPYEVWLLQYHDKADFENDPARITLTVYGKLLKKWREGKDFVVRPPIEEGERYPLQ